MTALAEDLPVSWRLERLLDFVTRLSLGDGPKVSNGRKSQSPIGNHGRKAVIGTQIPKLL